MSETETLFGALRQSSDEAAVDMLEGMVRDAPDHALNKMNALDLARTAGIDEERVIAAFLNAVGLGMFEMTWNVMCPSCAGVLSANKSLKTLNSAQYNCAFCAAGYETTLDNLVEVTFTVARASGRSRPIVPTNCPQPNIIARSSGVRRSIFLMILRSCWTTSRSKSSICRQASGPFFPCRRRRAP